MKNLLLTFIAMLFIFLSPGISTAQSDKVVKSNQNRISELNKLYEVLRKTVQDGDFQGYSALYHQDAVVVFTAGENKKSIHIDKALAGWKEGFEDTRSGKIKADVEFRFSQRVGDENTAHESGIFNYRSYDQSGKLMRNYFGHLEMLLIKRNGEWKMIMEFQKKDATEQEWNKLPA